MARLEPESFRIWLRERARVAGFARAGFASCEPFLEERDRLTAWVEAGGTRHLPYLDPAKLLDPAAVMPGARTALVGFFPYARPDAVPGSAQGSLKLSRYLWGADYHGLLKVRLNRLLAEAQERWPGLVGRACVDSAPLMERALAVRAGLGWRGKNTLLIAGKGGSWGFLGVLLLDAELAPDAAFPGERCGTCTRCIQACPAGALEPFRMNPNRCISTFTLETEADPPPEVRHAMAETGWAAGCDACQEACPWNRQPQWGDPALWGGASPLHEAPAEGLRVGPSRWMALTRGTALRRVRHRHWLATLARIQPCASKES